MAITDAYATVQDYKAVAGKIDSSRDDVIEEALDAVTQTISAEAHQTFTKDAAAVARVWFGNGSDTLKVYGQNNCPGIADSTGMSVVFDSGYNGTYQTTFATGTYELHPLSAALGREPGPYKELFLPYWTTGSYRFWLPGYRVKVTAIYGWPSVPSGIKRKTIELTRMLQMDGPRSTNRIDDMGVMLSTSRKARDIIDEIASQYYEPVFA